MQDQQLPSFLVSDSRQNREDEALAPEPGVAGTFKKPRRPLHDDLGLDSHQISQEWATRNRPGTKRGRRSTAITDTDYAEARRANRPTSTRTTIRPPTRHSLTKATKRRYPIRLRATGRGCWSTQGVQRVIVEWRLGVGIFDERDLAYRPSFAAMAELLGLDRTTVRDHFEAAVRRMERTCRRTGAVSAEPP